MSYMKYVIFVLGWLFLATFGQAASFDCTQAATKVEKLICSDDELSKLDESLNETYLRVLKRTDIKKQVIKSQKQWLKNVRKVCQNVECIKDVYKTRIKELGFMSSQNTSTLKAPVNVSKSQVIEPSVQACEYVASQANKGQLQNILLKTAPDDSPDIKVPESISGTVFKRIMDINNDGVMERVFVDSQGTAHFEDFSVYKLKTDEVIEMKALWNDNWSDNKERWVADRSFVEYKGVTYVLGKTDQSLSYLLYINPSNEIQVVCEFGQREIPLQHLKKSRNDKVCKQALNDQINYVEYNKLHSLSYNEVCNAGFRETHSGDRAALIDIDNDGKKELVVSLGLASGSGRGCDSTFPAVLTGDRTSIDKSYIKKLPFGRCGGTEVKSFIVDGKTYLDEKQPGPHAEHRQIYILNKDKLEPICEFEVRPDNYVQSEAESVEKAAENKGDLWEYVVLQPGTTAVDALLKEGKHLNKALKAQKELKPYCFFPIGAALFYKRDDILEKLLKAGADPNLTGAKDISTNLSMAVSFGTTKAVNLLLMYGAKDKDDGPLSAMPEAIRHKDIEKLETLLKGGIRISCSAALNAIEINDQNKYTILKLMMKYGLNPNMVCSKHYPTKGVIQEAPGVLKIGPEVKFITIDKPLFQWAKESGDPEVIKILSETGSVLFKERIKK